MLIVALVSLVGLVPLVGLELMAKSQRLKASREWAIVFLLWVSYLCIVKGGQKLPLQGALCKIV